MEGSDGRRRISDRAPALAEAFETLGDVSELARPTVRALARTGESAPGPRSSSSSGRAVRCKRVGRTDPLLPLPGPSDFPEMNLRTYVRVGDRAGVFFFFFFSLDAGNRLGVLLARIGYRFPNFSARMSIEDDGNRIRYRSDGRVGSTSFAASYAPVDDPFTPTRGTVEYFLTERYAFYTVTNGGAGHRGRDSPCALAPGMRRGRDQREHRSGGGGHHPAGFAPDASLRARAGHDHLASPPAARCRSHVIVSSGEPSVRGDRPDRPIPLSRRPV